MACALHVLHAHVLHAHDLNFTPGERAFLADGFLLASVRFLNGRFFHFSA